MPKLSLPMTSARLIFVIGRASKPSTASILLVRASRSNVALRIPEGELSESLSEYATRVGLAKGGTACCGETLSLTMFVMMLIQKDVTRASNGCKQELASNCD